jgi:hypothetical protein
LKFPWSLVLGILMLSAAASKLGERICYVPRPPLTFSPYAEAHCTQQNAQSGGEAFQDHRTWQGFEIAFFATAFVVDQKRKAQTPACQSGARGRDGCGASKGKSAFRLKGRDAALRRPDTSERCP